LFFLFNESGLQIAFIFTRFFPLVFFALPFINVLVIEHDLPSHISAVLNMCFAPLISSCKGKSATFPPMNHAGFYLILRAKTGKNPWFENLQRTFLGSVNKEA